MRNVASVGLLNEFYEFWNIAVGESDQNPVSEVAMLIEADLPRNLSVWLESWKGPQEFLDEVHRLGSVGHQNIASMAPATPTGLILVLRSPLTAEEGVYSDSPHHRNQFAKLLVEFNDFSMILDKIKRMGALSLIHINSLLKYLFDQGH